MNLTHILIFCHLILFQKHIILEASAASIIRNKYAGDVAKKWDKEQGHVRDYNCSLYVFT